ncbi:bifunctional 3-(3-hydroxy-phenyl)propionate/3-hydroxycinnamic acid hydroxylase MhpA [Nannocystis punicea]|uniref:Bifunctional 3-(3-hydroxy-phenyl)propionate/3-hydroxycinnamic acid hydroxylase n=1 Tax=Nannocystis punicea TaxID=2995304 RepID=A0ABY7H2A9_9BACT|nr:bifunctional 3-(3-hydroxy-phenyl)propionate/3-hydroxycinnamic acid hydroxylase [Nannocystis poenicansa]WAS93159.1 bifunctional 3-(3-hydroxy-phenyl)propionate/3-hydroxycinnamic acid hydroxylase [Nannocystis poenicansa]
MSEVHALECDVAIVGCGPVGAVAANFLGMAGLSCVVVEREAGEHGQPRAFSCDDEALRIYQQIGLADRLLANMASADRVDYTGVAGRPFAELRCAGLDFGSTYSPLHFFHQPTLEATLREGMRRFPSVSLRLGCEVTGLRAGAEAVTLSLRGPAGPTTLAARYVLGCDGARSTIRQLLGVVMHGARYDEPWLAISGFAEPGALRVPNTRFVCDPARPTFVGVGPAGEVRIERMILRGETPASLERPESVRAFVAPFVDPDGFRITRAATYRFGKHVAERWQVGRVFLLGDAAHQMPPFMGQGLCSGLRDVANLTWKLTAVLTGAADPKLLATYELERRAHTQAMIDVSVRMGQVFLTNQPRLAAVRDAVFCAIQRIGRVRRFIRDFEFKPPPLHRAGFIAGGRRPRGGAQGTYFPQVRGEAGRSDELLGPGFAVVGLEVDPRAVDRDGAFLNGLNARFVRVRAAPAASEAGLFEVVDASGRLAAWFARHRAAVAIVRPDRHVFAAGPMHAAASLGRTLATALREPPGPPT